MYITSSTITWSSQPFSSTLSSLKYTYKLISLRACQNLGSIALYKILNLWHSNNINDSRYQFWNTWRGLGSGWFIADWRLVECTFESLRSVLGGFRADKSNIIINFYWYRLSFASIWIWCGFYECYQSIFIYQLCALCCRLVVKELFRILYIHICIFCFCKQCRNWLSTLL